MPTDQEFHTLENTLKDSGQSCVSTRNSEMFGTDSCIGAGTSMKINGTSDFDAILLGARTSENSAYLSWGSEFQGLDTKVYFWTANETSTSSATTRIIAADASGTYRVSKDKLGAFAVRCIRDY
ncbi:hypothetical protein IPN41_03730 [Candidatus Falkowbacteria bacterium]|nr:MAG: hypothetical protein IPN41_03730 [Candidatus Falkowbacteria bacterium]